VLAIVFRPHRTHRTDAAGATDASRSVVCVSARVLGSRVTRVGISIGSAVFAQLAPRLEAKGTTHAGRGHFKWGEHVSARCIADAQHCAMFACPAFAAASGIKTWRCGLYFRLLCTLAAANRSY